MAEAQAPAEAPAPAEAHEPAYTPARAQTWAARYASELANATAWPAISQAAHALDVNALRRELSAGVGVDTLVMGPEDEASNTGGRTPLQLVCETTNESIVYQRGGTEEAFIRWAAEPPDRRREIDEGINADRVACVALLLEHGASPNPAGPSITPLMGAAVQGSLTVVNMLLAAGSDANTPWHAGGQACTPLFMVVLTKRRQGPAIADALLKAGADANPSGFIGKTLMAWAIGGGDHRFWPVLLRGGTLLPPREDSSGPGESYDSHRAHPYLEKIEAAGSWTAYEKAHRAKLLATFTPKFTHLVPPELVPLILEFSFHIGFY